MEDNIHIFRAIWDWTGSSDCLSLHMNIKCLVDDKWDDLEVRSRFRFRFPPSNAQDNDGIGRDRPRLEVSGREHLDLE